MMWSLEPVAANPIDMSGLRTNQLAYGFQSKLLLSITAVCLCGVFIFGVISWLIDRAENVLKGTALEKGLHVIVRFYCVYNLLTMIGWAALLTDPTPVSDISLTYIRGLQIVSVVGAAGVFVALWSCCRTWLRADAQLVAKFEETALFIAFVVYGALLRRLI